MPRPNLAWDCADFEHNRLRTGHLTKAPSAWAANLNMRAPHAPSSGIQKVASGCHAGAPDILHANTLIEARAPSLLDLILCFGDSHAGKDTLLQIKNKSCIRRPTLFFFHKPLAQRDVRVSIRRHWSQARRCRKIGTQLRYLGVIWWIMWRTCVHNRVYIYHWRCIQRLRGWAILKWSSADTYWPQWSGPASIACDWPRTAVLWSARLWALRLPRHTVCLWWSLWRGCLWFLHHRMCPWFSSQRFSDSDSLTLE